MLGDARVRWWMATPSCRGRASKRGENQELVTLSDAGSVVELQLEEILELDTALDKLNAVAPRLRLVVELRFFCGPPRTRSVGRWASRHERLAATGSRRGSSCSRSSHQSRSDFSRYRPCRSNRGQDRKG